MHNIPSTYISGIQTQEVMVTVNGGVATIADFMSTRIASLSINDNALDIAKRMVERNLSSIAITDDNQNIVGIVTERDIVRAVVNKIHLEQVSAASFMSSQMVSIEMGSSLEDAARVMAQKKIRHLLVEDAVNHEIVGMVTVTDMAKYLKRNLADEELAASQVWELFF